MKARVQITRVALLAFLAACSVWKPSEEDLALAESLRAERDKIEAEITSAQVQDAALAGGLIKALIQVQIETLRTTQAIIEQRIHAIEGGARLRIEVASTEPDSVLATSLAEEIDWATNQIAMAQAEANRYSGGLIAALAQTTLATEQQTLAMLRQRYISAKYGLPQLTAPAASGALVQPTGVPSSQLDPATADVENEIVAVKVLRKRFAEREYQEYVFLDIEFTAGGLDKPARSIKGTLHLTDLFGEVKLSLGWTIDDPIAPGATATERGSGFKFNQFMDDHQWARNTDLANMAATYTVQSILYQDGTRRDF
jgi:hypothetical protein